MRTRDTLAIDGKASPRKPKVLTFSIASSGNFEVAWRSNASAISAGLIPRSVVGDFDQVDSACGQA